MAGVGVHLPHTRDGNHFVRKRLEIISGLFRFLVQSPLSPGLGAGAAHGGRAFFRGGVAVTVTDQAWIDEVLYELAAQLPTGPAWDSETTLIMHAIALQMPVIWSMYAGYANVPFRQPLYAKRRALEILVGQLRLKRDGQLGAALRVQGSVLFKNLDSIRKAIDAEIAAVESRAKANMAPAIGLIIQRQPVTTPQFYRPTPVTTFANVNGATVATTKEPPIIDSNWAGYRGSSIETPAVVQPE